MRYPNGSASQPTVTSPFGPRDGSVGSSWHLGVDFIGCNPIRAIAAGRVVASGSPPPGWSGGGNQVWIQHDGFYSRSMHMGSDQVSDGDWVEEGQILGAQDTTGTASGSNLHLEIGIGTITFSNSGQVDPLKFLRERVGGGGQTAGGQSSDVAQMQLDLTTCGYPTEADGDAGPATKASVEAFQSANGLERDGIAGPITLAKLKKVVSYIQGLLIKIGYALTQDGYSGPQTIGAIKDLQGKNGLTVDGSVGPKTSAVLHALSALPVGRNSIPDTRSTADVQRLVGAKVDGIWGPETTAKVVAWQTARGLTADGVWGPASDAVGFPPAQVVLEVDGVWGTATTEALQRNLGVPVTGLRDEATVKALQTALGMTGDAVDGIWGEDTATLLQLSLGVAADGDFGPLSTTALQTLLNRGGRITPPVTGTPSTPPVSSPWNTTSRAGAEILAVVGARTDGTDAVARIKAWQTANHLEADGVWRGDSDGVAFATEPTLEFLTSAVRTVGGTTRKPGATLDKLGVHHTATTADQRGYFAGRNGRLSMPTAYLKSDGRRIGFIPAHLQPWSTGSADENAIAVEIQNSTGEPDWKISDAAGDSLVDIMTELAVANRDGTRIDGLEVTFKLDRDHVFLDRETRATACPGPYVTARIDQYIARARAAMDATPGGNPEPQPDTVPVSRSWLQSVLDKIKSLLGGGA